MPVTPFCFWTLSESSFSWPELSAGPTRNSRPRHRCFRLRTIRPSFRCGTRWWEPRGEQRRRCRRVVSEAVRCGRVALEPHTLLGGRRAVKYNGPRRPPCYLLEGRSDERAQRTNDGSTPPPSPCRPPPAYQP